MSGVFKRLFGVRDDRSTGVEKNFQPGRISVSDPEVQRRIHYNSLTEADLGVIQAWRPECSAVSDNLIDAFYNHVKSNPVTMGILDKHTTVERQRPGVTRYVLTFFNGLIDNDYVAMRQHVGRLHDNIDLDSSWYVAM